MRRELRLCSLLVDHPFRGKVAVRPSADVHQRLLWGRLALVTMTSHQSAMKRSILVSILAVALVSWYCLRHPARMEGQAITGQPLQDASATPPAPLALPVGTVMSATSNTTRPETSPLTDHRRQIFDSPDVMATINRLHASGTADEKEWALSLLVGCVHVNARAAAPRPDAEASEEGPPVVPGTQSQLKALEQRAADELALRCGGVKAMAHLQDRQPLQGDLRAAAVANRSTLGQLEALASNQDDRWSSEQARQITESLYSGDPVLARAAFFALLGAMDRDSPGGAERNAAFIAALGPIYTHAPLSDFERLSTCAAMGLCGSPSDAEDPGLPPNSEVLRLAQKYRAAVASRLDARSIMAIR
jgi:hypothetical protein